jgi:hypothetical protein
MTGAVLALLEGGAHRSIGKADEVVALVESDAALLTALISGTSAPDPDPVLGMRGADAAEKATHVYRRRLPPALGRLAAPG